MLKEAPAASLALLLVACRFWRCLDELLSQVQMMTVMLMMDRLILPTFFK